MGKILTPPTVPTLNTSTLAQALGIGLAASRDGTAQGLLIGSGPNGAPALLIGGRIAYLAPLCGALKIWKACGPTLRTDHDWAGTVWYARSDSGAINEIHAERAIVESGSLLSNSDWYSELDRIARQLPIVSTWLYDKDTGDFVRYAVGLTGCGFMPTGSSPYAKPICPENEDELVVSHFRSAATLTVEPHTVAQDAQSIIEWGVYDESGEFWEDGTGVGGVFACAGAKPGVTLRVPCRIQTRTEATLLTQGTTRFSLQAKSAKLYVWSVPMSGTWANDWPSSPSIPDGYGGDYGFGINLGSNAHKADPTVSFPACNAGSATSWADAWVGNIDVVVPDSRVVAIGLIDDGWDFPSAFASLLALPNGLDLRKGAVQDSEGHWDLTQMENTYLDFEREARLLVDWAGAYPVSAS